MNFCIKRNKQKNTLTKNTCREIIQFGFLVKQHCIMNSNEPSKFIAKIKNNLTKLTRILCKNSNFYGPGSKRSVNCVDERMLFEIVKKRRLLLFGRTREKELDIILFITESTFFRIERKTF